MLGFGPAFAALLRRAAGGVPHGARRALPGGGGFAPRRSDVPARSGLPRRSGGLSDGRLVSRRRSDGRPPRDSRGAARRRVRRRGGGVPPLAADPGGRLSRRRRGRRGMGRAAYRLLRRRSGTDLSGGALRGRLPRLDARAGQALARGAGTGSRPGRGGRDSLQRAGGHALHAPRRTGDARRAAARGRHGPAFPRAGRRPADAAPLGRQGAGDAGPLRGERLLLADAAHRGHSDVRLLEFDGYDHGNMPQAGHPAAVRYIRGRCDKIRNGR